MHEVDLCNGRRNRQRRRYVRNTHTYPCRFMIEVFKRTYLCSNLFLVVRIRVTMCVFVSGMAVAMTYPLCWSMCAGMGDVHDGVNFMRSACVIAVEKAQSSFDPMLEVQDTASHAVADLTVDVSCVVGLVTQALRHRMVHIMRRLFPIVEYMLRRGGSALLQETHTKPFQAMVRSRSLLSTASFYCSLLLLHYSVSLCVLFSIFLRCIATR